MISGHDNEILTRVGPDTPMGQTMRRYWLPVCTSAQLPEPDSRPLRVALLGEAFVAFRDSRGRVGLLDEFCMHRRASLALGRVEKNGIRCLYHGWKFGVDGAIHETPNHPDPRLREGLRAPAYPVREAGGLVWTYIGPKDKEPPFQRFAFMDGPEANRVVLRINTAANWLQLYEGGTDSSHVGILHSNRANPGWLTDSFVRSGEDYNPGALAVADNAPVLDVEATEYGYHYVAKRRGPPRPDGAKTWSIRVTPVIFPCGRIIPAPAFQFYVFEVPQHDAKTSTYLICHGTQPIDRAAIIRLMGLDDARFWNERDCEFRASWDSVMNQDRDRMHENWSGFSGIEQEDAVCGVDGTGRRPHEGIPGGGRSGRRLSAPAPARLGPSRRGGRRSNRRLDRRLHAIARAGRHRHRPDNALAGCDARSSRRQTGRIIPGLRDHRLACQRHVRRPRGSLM
jgi:phthalate 4,5-dioxygenase oxygenase subunit